MPANTQHSESHFLSVENFLKTTRYLESKKNITKYCHAAPGFFSRLFIAAALNVDFYGVLRKKKINSIFKICEAR
jgi:hypothetical protein